MVNKKYYLLEQWVMNGYALVRWPVYVLERWTASKVASNHNFLLKAAQIAQNKMLRMLDRVTLKDQIPSQTLLTKYNLSSVNQLAAEIKMTEAWKSIHINNYPSICLVSIDGGNIEQKTISNGCRQNQEAKLKNVGVVIPRSNQQEAIQRAPL